MDYREENTGRSSQESLERRTASGKKRTGSPAAGTGNTAGRRTSSGKATGTKTTVRKSSTAKSGKTARSSSARPMTREERERARTRSRIIRILGRIAVFVEIVLSIILLLRMRRTGFFPARLMVITGIVLFVLVFAMLFLNLSKKRKIRRNGLIITLVICILLGFGIRYINQTIGLIAVGNESYKTDDMIVAVRSNDPAETLHDCADYVFGYKENDQTGGAAMLEDIRTVLEKDVALKGYNSEVEIAKALISGEINAAIYNQAYDTVLKQVVEGYDGNTKIVHHYGYRTDFADADIQTGESFNVMISGIDVYGDISQSSRSDVNIIMTVNPRTKRILLTSTPRDYFVYIPEISGDERDKLTHAGIYGVDASMRTLEELYGVKIDYFIRVNFDTLIQLVDAVGGLDIYVEYSFDAYTDDFYFERGWHHMNGDQCLAFCRERYSFADGDNQRGRDQEQVLDALLDKLMSPAILMSVGQLLDDLEGSYQTNIPESKIVELVNMQLSDGAVWNIHKQTADEGYGELQPTYSGGSQPLYVMWPDYGSVKRNRVRMVMIFEENPKTEE